MSNRWLPPRIIGAIGQHINDFHIGFYFTHQKHPCITGDTTAIEINWNFLPLTVAIDEVKSYEKKVCWVLSNVTIFCSKGRINMVACLLVVLLACNHNQYNNLIYILRPFFVSSWIIQDKSDSLACKDSHQPPSDAQLMLSFPSERRFCVQWF